MAELKVVESRRQRSNNPNFFVENCGLVLPVEDLVNTVPTKAGPVPYPT